MLLRVFLFFLLLPVLVFAQGQIQEKASDVLFDFATDHLDESRIEEIIGSNGLDQIIERTQNWKAEDTHYFVNFLTKEGVTPDHILKAIWIAVTFVFSTENHQGVETASDIFFDFATDHLTASDLEKVIGDGWLDDVIEHTQEWKTKDAHHLINSLKEAKIAPSDTLKIIRVMTHLLQKSTVPTAVLETVVETEVNREIPKGALKQEIHVAEEKSAAKVFIDFARKHRGENFERVMGSKWVQGITRYTQYWTAEEVTKFLDYLVGFIGLDLTLARIKTTSYLKRMHYDSFKEKVDFYSQEEYLGREKVRKKLSQSLNGFHTGQLEDIKNTIQKVKDIIGEEGIRRIFNKPKVNFGAFTVVNTEIVAIVNLLENMEEGYGIPRLAINEAIIRNLMAFTGGKVKNLKAIVDEIKSRVSKYGLPEEVRASEIDIQTKLNEAILRAPQAFTSGKVGNLKAIVEEVQSRLKSYGLSEGGTLSELEVEVKINETIMKNPQAFTTGKVENLKAIVGEIKSQLKNYGLPEGIKLSEIEIEIKLNEAILRDTQAFTGGKVENLKAVVEEIISRLKSYGLSEEVLSEVEVMAKLNEAMIRDPQVFTISKIENLKSVVEEIKRRLKRYGLSKGEPLSEAHIEAKINETIIRALQAFTGGRVENLRAIVEEIKLRLKSYGLPKGEKKLSEKEVEAKLNEAIIKSPHIFTRGNVEKLKDVLGEIKRRLKSYGLPKGRILSEAEIEARLNKLVMRNPGSFIRGHIEDLGVIMKEIKDRLVKYGLPKREALSELEVEAMLNETLIRDPLAFTNGKVENLKDIAKEVKSRLKSYGLPEKKEFSEQDIEVELNAVIMRNPQSFTKGKVENLKAIAEEIKSRIKSYGLPGMVTLPEVEINAVIIRNPQAFTDGRVENLKGIVEEVKSRLKSYGLPEENKLSEPDIEVKINTAIMRNPKAFTLGSAANLKIVVNKIEAQLNKHGLLNGKTLSGTIKAELTEVIINSPALFTLLQINRLKVIEKRFGVDGLIAALKNLSTEQSTEVVDTSVTNGLENLVVQDQENTEQDESDVCPSVLQ